MEVIRRFVTVKDHTINITLPDDFDAEEVEVIVLRSGNYNGEIPEWQIKQVRERTDEYRKNPLLGEEFNRVMDEIENEL